MQICIGILSLNDDAMPALDCYPGSREEVSQRLVSALPALGQSDEENSNAKMIV